MSNEIEIGRGKRGRRAFSFDDVAVVPSRRTRDPEEVSVGWQIDAYHFDLPILAAPMDSVMSPATAVALGNHGGLGVLDLEGLWTRYDDPTALLEEIAGLEPLEATRRMQEIYAEPIKADLITQRLKEIRAAGVTVAAALSPQRTQEHYQTVVDAGVDLFVIRGTTVSAEHVSGVAEPLNLKRFIYELDVPVVVGGASTYTAALHLMRTGAAGVLVLQAATGRPWDDDYARYLTGIATTIGAALRDAARMRTTLDELRRRAERSEEETARARELALVLQQAVLTEPPQPEDLEVAVHYQPATHDRDIGGDWYDAFVASDGVTTLVIGDVVGHDLGAAATMGQLRGLVRAIGYDSGATPARLLERVDAAIDGLALGINAVATAVVARIEQSDDERSRGVRTVRWSSAGHLPPVVVRADGTVEVLTVRNDLPLGLRPGAGRHDHTVELGTDDTLVLYTDGLVERRGHSIRDDVAALADALRGLAGASLDDVVRTALSQVLPGDGEDDVALVALRTGPQAAVVRRDVPGTPVAVSA